MASQYYEGVGRRKAASARVRLYPGGTGNFIVNEKDAPPDTEGSEKRDQVVKQGENRVERGENFIKAATGASQDLGVKLGWELHEAPDKVNDVYTMGDFAARLVYGKR